MECFGMHVLLAIYVYLNLICAILQFVHWCCCSVAGSSLQLLSNHLVLSVRAGSLCCWFLSIILSVQELISM